MTGKPPPRSKRVGIGASPANPHAEAWIRQGDADAVQKGDLYTARLTLDITPAMRARIKVSAFTRGVTVAELLRDLLEREFPRRARRERIRFDRPHPKAVRPRLRRRRRLRHSPARPATPLTRVALAYIEPRFKLYLRFGEPARTLQLDRWRRCCLPNAVLCRIRWQANDYGTIRWQLMVMQTATPLDAVQRIPGVQPGARLLLHAEGDANVRAVLERIDGIEALGIAAADTSPAYWRTLANRLAALGATHIHRRTARRLAGREGIAMTTISTTGPVPHPRSRLRSPRAGRLRHRRPRCAGLGGVRAAPAANGLQPVRQRGGRLVSHRTVRPRTASRPRPLSVDSIVLMPLPDRAAMLAAQRGYLPTRVPLLKRVGAVAPQHVCIVAGQVRIDGVPVAAALPADRLGRPLPSLQLCRRLQPGELFLLSATNPASFDSRYFGPVSAFAVIGVAHPIWLETRP